MALVRSSIITMAHLLDGVHDLHWRDDLVYVEGDRSSWSPDTSCAVIQRDPYEEEEPEVTIGDVVLGLALTGSQVAEVARNLENDLQSPARFVEAVRHFHEFDGFLPH